MPLRFVDRLLLFLFISTLIQSFLSPLSRFAIFTIFTSYSLASIHYQRIMCLAWARTINMQFHDSDDAVCSRNQIGFYQKLLRFFTFFSFGVVVVIVVLIAVICIRCSINNSWYQIRMTTWMGKCKNCDQPSATQINFERTSELSMKNHARQQLVCLILALSALILRQSITRTPDI